MQTNSCAVPQARCSVLFCSVLWDDVSFMLSLQVFIESASGLAGEELERELFIVRKLMEKEKVRAQ